jgi:hypothetical protein
MRQCPPRDFCALGSSGAVDFRTPAAFVDADTREGAAQERRGRVCLRTALVTVLTYSATTFATQQRIPND